MTDNKILSICIPSYNNSVKVVSLVNNILTGCTDERIEIVVVDNCSSDNTIEALEKITDYRFRLIEREENVGGNANVISSLEFAQGTYALLCLDKDKIDPCFLENFIDKLCQMEGIAFGHLSLNSHQIANDVYYATGLKSLLAMGYRCMHPSGMFVNVSALKQSDVLKIILEQYPGFPFSVDIIKAHLAELGGGCIINLPLVFTETLEEAQKKVSHTYSGNNVFFLPENIIKKMIVLVKDSLSLHLTSKEHKRIINKLYRSNLYDITLGFRDIMSNKAICAHYRLVDRKVSWKEVKKNHRQYIKSFIKMDIPFGIIWKLRVVVTEGGIWYVRKILSR